MRVVFLCSLLLILGFPFFAQEDTILVRSTLAHTFRVGALLQGTTGPDFYKDIMTMGSHGYVNPEYHAVNTGKLSYWNPYVSFGWTRQKSSWYGIYGGISYLSTKNDFDYTFVEYSDFDPDHIHYHKKVSSGQGIVLNQVFRIEITPTFYIRRTKIMIGFTNLDFVFAKLDVTPMVSNYYVAGHASGYDLPVDSVKTLTGIQTGDRIEKWHTAVHFPLTLGVEQEIPFGKGCMLIGARVLYSQFGSYYGFIFHTGYRIKRAKAKY
ncbi:MAG: hypothetical protein JST26_14755 [Bacteroidetes bacterium]|nr:hypothetical protein [Bacteroidota bacterium]